MKKKSVSALRTLILLTALGVATVSAAAPQQVEPQLIEAGQKLEARYAAQLNALRAVISAAGLDVAGNIKINL